MKKYHFLLILLAFAMSCTKDRFDVAAPVISTPVITDTTVSHGGNVMLNEFMANNSSTISNPQIAGGTSFDDWVEIYNSSDTAINLAGYYLTDDLSNLQKFRIPAGSASTIIAAHGYKLFWADGDTTLGVLHCNFKLSASGEALALSNAGEDVLDSISFSAQAVNVSFERLPNGGLQWNTSSNPTPGTSNQ